MPWDPFLMKKLLKKEVCGSVNSAQDPLNSAISVEVEACKRGSRSYAQCTGPINRRHPMFTCFSIKKKKRRWGFHCYPNIYLIVQIFLLLILSLSFIFLFLSFLSLLISIFLFLRVR